MIYQILLSIMIIAAYTTAVCLKSMSVPASISATFYKLNHPKWFMFTMWASALLLIPVALNVSGKGTEWASFLSCAGMLLIGGAPNFRDEFEGKIHTSGAVMALLFSQVWVAMNNPWFLFLWFAWSIGTLVKMITNDGESEWRDFLSAKPKFWVEVTALTTTYLTILTIM